jgi:hypothetical protein
MVFLGSERVIVVLFHWVVLVLLLFCFVLSLELFFRWSCFVGVVVVVSLDLLLFRWSCFSFDVSPGFSQYCIANQRLLIQSCFGII